MRPNRTVPEHDLLTAAGSSDHLSPGEVTQAGQADAEPPGLGAELVVEPGGRSHRASCTAVPSRRTSRGRTGRSAHRCRPACCEEALVLLLRDAQARLRDQVAIGTGRGQLRAAAGEKRLDLRPAHLQGGVIDNEVMLKFVHQPALSAGLARDGIAQQGGLGQIDPEVARIEAARHLLGAGPPWGSSSTSVTTSGALRQTT